jgi:hypothetical protein
MSIISISPEGVQPAWLLKKMHVKQSIHSLNLDEASAKEIADRLGIGGQSLMVVRGDKKIDITSAAWLAAHDTDKMKVEIKSGINKVLF